MRRWLAIAIVMAGLFVPAAPALAGGAVLYLAPASYQMTVGRTYYLVVRVSSSDSVNAVQANLSYTSNLLFEGISTQGSAFDITAQGSGGGGVVKIGRGASSPVSGDNNVATISFQAVAAGTATVTFNSDSQVVRNTDNAGILSGTSGGTYTISSQPPPSGGGGSTAPRSGSGTPAASSPSTPGAPAPPPDTTPPKVKNLHVIDISFTQATVEWDTDEPASSLVDYGLTASYGLEAQTGGLATHHAVPLNPAFLVPRTLYHFRIKSSDAAGNTVTGQDLHFVTSGYAVTAAISDQHGRPVSGAVVTLGDSQLTTDQLGKVQFVNVSPGRRLLTVIYRDQYQTANIAVGPDKNGHVSVINAAFVVTTPPPWWQTWWWLWPLAVIGLAWAWHNRHRPMWRFGPLLRRLRGRLNLQPHLHSGRVLPHAHTSYAGMAFVLLMGGLALGSVSLGSEAADGAYSVTATVQGPAPRQAALITSPASGDTVYNLPVEVKGTCESGAEIRLYTGQVLRGSQICQDDGSFDLPAALDPGTNILVARSFNLAGQEGPASDGVTVRYAPAPGSVEEAFYGSGVTQLSAPLRLTTDQPLVAAWTREAADWSVKISGGQPPYALQFDWGDGSTDLVSQPGPGGAAVTHAFKKSGSYTIKVTAKDNAGLSGYLQIAAVVHDHQGAVAAVRGSGIPNLAIAWPVYAALCLMLLSFWLGERFEKGRVAEQAADLAGGAA